MILSVSSASRRFLCGAALAALTAACGSSPGDVSDAVIPPMGKGDSLDVADRSCQIVLREVAIDVVGTVPQNKWVEWRGIVDLDPSLPADSQAHVIYRGMEGDFHEADVDDDGVFHLVSDTIRSGLGGQFDRHSLDLIPYVELEGGERLFDHNRIDDDFGMYRLSAENDHAVASDPLTCAEPMASDEADHDCRVVLRELTVDVVGTIMGNIWVEWRGRLSLADVPGGAEARVMYRSTSSQGWLEVAVESDGSFQLTDQTIRSGLSGGIFNSQSIEVIPFVILPGGGRLFDHNRNPDPSANYVLNAANEHQILDDPSVCGS